MLGHGLGNAHKRATEFFLNLIDQLLVAATVRHVKQAAVFSLCVVEDHVAMLLGAGKQPRMACFHHREGIVEKRVLLRSHVDDRTEVARRQRRAVGAVSDTVVVFCMLHELKLG
jgi:hypothetical protein